MAPRANPGHLGDVFEAALGLCDRFYKARLPVTDSFGRGRGVAGQEFRVDRPAAGASCTSRP
eukprot:9489559-Pyramimonas_sp.AAC.1